jgi:hypothetical protein
MDRGKTFPGDMGRTKTGYFDDMRGCGDSGLPEEGFTIRHLASDIEAVMQYTGIEKLISFPFPEAFQIHCNSPWTFRIKYRALLPETFQQRALR